MWPGLGCLSKSALAPADPAFLCSLVGSEAGDAVPPLPDLLGSGTLSPACFMSATDRSRLGLFGLASCSSYTLQFPTGYVAHHMEQRDGQVTIFCRLWTMRLACASYLLSQTIQLAARKLTPLARTAPAQLAAASLCCWVSQVAHRQAQQSYLGAGVGKQLLARTHMDSCLPTRS